MTVKLVVLYTHPDDADAFEEHYAGYAHAAGRPDPRIAADRDGLGAAPQPMAGEKSFHRITELYFDSPEALQAGFGCDEGSATAATTRRSPRPDRACSSPCRRLRSRWAVGAGLPLAARHGGQVNGHRQAAAWGIGKLRCSAVGRDQAMHDGQAEARATRPCRGEPADGSPRCALMPGPSSATTTLIREPACRAASVMFPPAGTASMALARRLSRICSRWPSRILAVRGSIAVALSSTGFSSAAGFHAEQRSLITAST
jgi:hypothetical protein